MVASIFGGNVRQAEKSTNKIIYHYLITSSEAVDMLKVLLSFLKEKRQQARLAIEFHESKEGFSPDAKEQYYQEMKNLKVIGNIFESPELLEVKQ